MADKENSESLTSFSKITLGEIIKDLWGERVKHVKRGPRSDRKAAYLNIRRSEGGIGKSLGFTLEEISIPQTWTRECVAPGHYIFSRCEKMDYNSQRLTLDLSVKLSQSFQASYTIRSHGSFVDLESVLRNSGSTTPAFPGQIPCLLQWLENLPICLGFVLEKGEAVVTLSPYTTGQLQDLADCSKEPETRVFSDLCLVVCKSGATSQCLNCRTLFSLNRRRQKRISNRQVIPPKCNKRFLSREELVDQVAQEQVRRKHAEERERYWRSKYDSEALVVDEEDNADLDSMFWATKKENIPKEMECLWEQQKKNIQTAGKNGHRWHPK